MRFIFLFLAIILNGCSNQQQNPNEIWVYTSLYKDTISELTPYLEKEFPGVKINWFQAGSEEIATKVNAEIMAGNIKADVLISSDRFWYEEMAGLGKLISYISPRSKDIPSSLKNPQGFYSTLSIPVMVLTHHPELKDPPKSFKELADPKWKNQITSGSPLASGTNFTTMAMLQYKYGWEFIKQLKDNNIISDGGNSAVIRKLQTREKTVGWVLLENLLRLKGDQQLGIIYPTDGVVTQANVIAITNKKRSNDLVQKFVDFMYSDIGQKLMTNSFMYSPLMNIEKPTGAPDLKFILDNSFNWSEEFIKNVVENREEIKEQYTEIMYE